MVRQNRLTWRAHWPLMKPENALKFCAWFALAGMSVRAVIERRRLRGVDTPRCVSSQPPPACMGAAKTALAEPCKGMHCLCACANACFQANTSRVSHSTSFFAATQNLSRVHVRMVIHTPRKSSNDSTGDVYTIRKVADVIRCHACRNSHDALTVGRDAARMHAITRRLCARHRL